MPPVSTTSSARLGRRTAPSTCILPTRRICSARWPSSARMEMDALAGGIGPITPDRLGAEELRRFLAEFFTTYRRYGPVIHAWMEGHVADREVTQLGVHAFTDIATVLGRRMREAGVPGDPASIPALMALLERSRVLPRLAPPRLRRRHAPRQRHQHRSQRLFRRSRTHVVTRGRERSGRELRSQLAVFVARGEVDRLGGAEQRDREQSADQTAGRDADERRDHRGRG